MIEAVTTSEEQFVADYGRGGRGRMFAEDDTRKAILFFSFSVTYKTFCSHFFRQNNLCSLNDRFIMISFIHDNIHHITEICNFKCENAI